MRSVTAKATTGTTNTATRIAQVTVLRREAFRSLTGNQLTGGDI
ncbi:hypothetical protein ACH5AL_16360 [Actinacidiphila glaucinigra]